MSKAAGRLLAICTGISGREELFFSFPNEEALLPLFIDDVHLRGIFHVFDRDQCCEIAGFLFPVFAEDVNAAVTVYIVGAAHRFEVARGPIAEL